MGVRSQKDQDVKLTFGWLPSPSSASIDLRALGAAAPPFASTVFISSTGSPPAALCLQVIGNKDGKKKETRVCIRTREEREMGEKNKSPWRSLASTSVQFTIGICILILCTMDQFMADHLMCNSARTFVADKYKERHRCQTPVVRIPAVRNICRGSDGP